MKTINNIFNRFSLLVVALLVLLMDKSFGTDMLDVKLYRNHN